MTRFYELISLLSLVTLHSYQCFSQLQEEQNASIVSLLSHTQLPEESLIKCKSYLLYDDGASLDCSINGSIVDRPFNEDDFLKATVKASKRGGKNYTISDYPEPIVGFTAKIIGDVSIEHSTLTVFPNLTQFLLHGADKDHNVVNIPPGEFNHTPQLKSLRFQGVVLSNDTLKSIRSAANAQMFAVSRCQLGGHLPSGLFRGMNHLKFLGLEGNDIVTLEPDTFDGLPNVTLINMNENGIEKLPPGLFDNLPNLERLEMVFNRIDGLPGGTFRGAPGLLLLHLMFNRITKLDPDSFSGLTKLTDLQLIRNGFDSLPDGIFRDTKNLVHLDLSSNEIKQINSTTFAGLKNLKRLDLNSNEIVSIEAGAFDDLANLRWLKLQYNLITILPDGLFRNNNQLESIGLKGTCIENISASNFTHCPDFLVKSLEGTCLGTSSMIIL